MTFLAVSPESRAQSSDDTRAGARDFGDITSFTGPRFPRGKLDGEGDQVDYYRFTLAEAKRVVLGLRQQDADADMFLEDADGNELYGSTASGTDNEVIAGTLLAGTYYVRVESQEAGTNAYVFRYGVSAPDAGALAALQEQQSTPETVSEPDGEDLSDDTRAGATDFGDITELTGPRFPRGTLNGEGDQVDYYRFTLTEAKRVVLGLRQQDADADMFLEDSDGDELYGSTASGTDNEVIAQTLLAGTYYVRVESQEAGTNAYVFRYGVSAPDPDALAALQAEQGTPETVSEPDGEDLSTDTSTDEDDTGGEQDTPETVSEPDGEDFSADTSTDGRVAVGGTATGEIGSEGDRDWFAVELVAGATYTIDLRGKWSKDGTLVDPYLRGIHDADGNLIADTTNDDGGLVLNSRVTFTATESGTHYIAAGAHGSRQGTYALEVTEVSPVMRVSDATATEGEDSSMEFHVTLDRASPETVTVNYATVDGTAEAGLDYEQSSGTLTFAPGETEEIFEVTVIDDSYEDSGETFRVVLSDASGARLGDDEGVGTIHNTDPVTNVDETDGGGDLPNNTSTRGWVLVGGGPASGSVRGTDGSSRPLPDQDWYRVALDAGTTYRIDISPEGSGDIGFHLRGIYHAQGWIIYQTSDTTSGPDRNPRLYFTPDDSGDYYISVTLAGVEEAIRNSRESYRLTVVEDSPDGDDYADDDTTTGAVTVDGLEATGEITYAHDRDWFAVQLTAGTSYEVLLRRGGSDPLATPLLTGIHDADGNFIPGTRNFGAIQEQIRSRCYRLHEGYRNDGCSSRLYTSRVEFTPDSTGTYYISASAHASTTGSYEVEVNTM